MRSRIQESTAKDDLERFDCIFGGTSLGMVWKKVVADGMFCIACWVVLSLDGQGDGAIIVIELAFCATQLSRSTTPRDQSSCTFLCRVRSGVFYLYCRCRWPNKIVSTSWSDWKIYHAVFNVGIGSSKFNAQNLSATFLLYTNKIETERAE